LRANSGTAASTMVWRRSSLSRRVAAMMRTKVSVHSLRVKTHGLRQKRHKKMGGLPPKAAQSAVWQWPSTPISGRDARHTQEGRSGIWRSGATAKSPINRAIHDNRHLRPLSPERSPALCTFAVAEPLSVRWILTRTAGEGDHAKHGGGGMRALDQRMHQKEILRGMETGRFRPLRLALLATSPA
jgi:hypothetical protein